MERFLRRAWAEIDLDAVVGNYKEAKKNLPSGTKIMAVLKADANNIGDLALVDMLEPFLDDWYAVSNIKEAILLREHGSIKPILILGYTPVSMADMLAKYQITQAILSAEYADLLISEAKRINKRIDVHIKLDTGMSRVGIMCYDDYVETFVTDSKAILEEPFLNVTGIFTHMAAFYNMDSDSREFTGLQFSRFMKACDLLQQKGYDIGLRHCCNSPGMINHPEKTLDMVRIGTALFGGLIEAYNLRGIPFKQCLTIKTAVSCVKTIDKGTYVGYGRSFKASRRTKVATLSIGYSDICRIGKGLGAVLINDQICQVIGAVSMDQCTVDVSDVHSIEIGDEAILLGKSNTNEITLSMLANFLDTDSEEVYCHLTKRLPHLYLKKGKPCYWVEYLPQIRSNGFDDY